MRALKEDSIERAAAKHPNPQGVKFSYGTAGFRMLATQLDGVVFRVALVAALRSASMNGQTIGLMITASHNPEQDNGVKIVDPNGDMLASEWEAHATAVANATTASDIVAALDAICAQNGLRLASPEAMSVAFGHDTRPSCAQLVEAVKEGLGALQCASRDVGLVTTPQLHYLVSETNTRRDGSALPCLEDYYRRFAQSFAQVVKQNSPSGKLVVDCANGVGATAMRGILAQGLPLDIEIINYRIDASGALNNGCGADFVKTKQQAPSALELREGVRYCSFDGDADRIVYFYQDTNGHFALLDGDKIASLITSFLQKLVKACGLPLQIGIVQTAYANGASTRYVEQTLHVPVVCVPTGVKYLHHAAKEFDIGVYFEANGHGTVLFSPAALAQIQQRRGEQAISQLAQTCDVINQCVGDALSDMLLIEAALSQMQWSLAEWDALYKDLPNRLVKVIVRDRSVFKTTDAERTLVEPKGMQGKIDAIVSRYSAGRSFVRPSGTEDCVRVYAEASSRQAADDLAHKVASLVFDEAGSGERPARFA